MIKAYARYLEILEYLFQRWTIQRIFNKWEIDRYEEMTE